MNVGIDQIILYSIKQMQYGYTTPETSSDNSGMILFLIIMVVVGVTLFAIVLANVLSSQKSAGVNTSNQQVTSTTSVTSTTLTTMSFCPHCGAKIQQQDALYCIRCGQPTKF